MGDINECPSVVVLCEGASKADQAKFKQAMEPLAKKYIAEGKAEGDDPKYIFFIAAAGGKPLVLLFDIPDNGGFYVADIAEVTTESLEKFLASKDKGSETRLQLGGVN